LRQLRTPWRRAQVIANSLAIGRNNCSFSARACMAKWENLKLEGEAPVGRSSHGASVFDGKFVLWGGEHVAREYIDSEVWTFADGKWAKIPAANAAPEPRVAHAQAVIGNKLYISGGRQGIQLGEDDLNDLHSFDLTTGEWTTLTPAGEPYSSRSFHQGCAAQGKFYIFGGCPGNTRAADLHEYDPAVNRWTRLPDPIQADGGAVRGRGGAGFTADISEKYLYVIAGFAGEETNDCYRYDITAASWTQIPGGALRPRSVFGLTPLKNNIIIFGGEVDPSAAGHSGAGDFAGDLFCLNTDDLTFSPVEAVGGDSDRLPRGWTRIVADRESSFLLFGGLAGNDENPIRLDDMWRCTLT